MIARTWRGATRAADADAYVAYLRETGVAACRSTPGNLGASVLHRARPDAQGVVDFLFISWWDDMDGVARFAGPDPERAVFYPSDDAFLVERDMHVDHWLVAER